MYYLALYLSLTLKITVLGQQPSRVSGTRTESHNLKRLRLCVVTMVKDTVGLKQCTSLIEEMFKLVDGMNYIYILPAC